MLFLKAKNRFLTSHLAVATIGDKISWGTLPEKAFVMFYQL